MRVDIENGKYTYVSHDSGAELLRYGEPWQDVTGQKVWYCAAYELQEVREERDALAAHLETLKSSFHELVGCSDDVKEPTGYVLIQECDFDCVIADFKRTPETSLNRMKSKWQAEALGRVLAEVLTAVEADTVRAHLRNAMRKLRRQVEGGET